MVRLERLEHTERARRVFAACSYRDELGERGWLVLLSSPVSHSGSFPAKVPPAGFGVPHEARLALVWSTGGQLIHVKGRQGPQCLVRGV